MLKPKFCQVSSALIYTFVISSLHFAGFASQPLNSWLQKEYR